MRKFGITVLIIILLGLIGGAYYVFTRIVIINKVIPTSVKELTITIPYHSWSFEPDVIEVQPGTELHLTLVNQDDIEHGFAIDEYWINESLPPYSTTSIPAFVASTSGDLRFYCSVTCGEGVAEEGVHAGSEIGHFDMQGTLRVQGLVTPVASSSINN